MSIQFNISSKGNVPTSVYEGPVSFVSDINETEFKLIFSNTYKIKVPNEAIVEINKFLNSEALLIGQ